LFVIRAVVAFAALFVLGLGIAFLVTKDRKYLRIAWRSVLAVLLLVVVFALLYVFERVLLL
jgi:nucleoside permease NupC